MGHYEDYGFQTREASKPKVKIQWADLEMSALLRIARYNVQLRRIADGGPAGC